LRSAAAAAVLALTLVQTGSQAYAGTWIAEIAGTTYARLDLTVTNGTLSGRISLGDIHVDDRGEVDSADAAPPASSAIFSVRLRDSTLSFSRKDGDDTEQFEMRLLSGQAAELVFLPTDADLEELAENGVPRPRPFRLKKVAR
jgi:hypothetical protein